VDVNGRRTPERARAHEREPARSGKDTVKRG
jgi:hypothetical protein